ncbi:hypothetical protein [Streptococcus acidominimus]|nr:hypothetical protein [Streptococcus acidominimus]
MLEFGGFLLSFIGLYSSKIKI